ncbi:MULTISPECIES: hypothetical protein [Leptospira]|uniref:Uncharacterized protein n=1 Tax=Leptospira weilii str. 2006001853 TaxID=1001589 RepID=A0A828Z3G3_9LEPT|nr:MULTISPECIES: hypothetical protein [Leptospira]EKR65821.1 hypothetical protein LEP1GSC036_2607 [Leptospira weilii str. 2006001853]EMJ63429.1 hypothetical protein LEP1GSC051_2532 [Leptospira sp. P2653]QDK21565.1 hypothetical protein FHG67_01405 [Leptospira weilii]QDK24970.1 hypothetical protein FHG67_19855 [Leptospira weilii]QDK25530.1 hypothetical protein FHG68_01415 [Leptospira weilii]
MKTKTQPQTTWTEPKRWEVFEPTNEIQRKAATAYCNAKIYADLTDVPIDFLFLADRHRQLNTQHIPYVRIDIPSHTDFAVYVHVWIVAKQSLRLRDEIQAIEKELNSKKRRRIA